LDRFTRKNEVVVMPSLPVYQVPALFRGLVYQIRMQHLRDFRLRGEFVPVIEKQSPELTEILEL
jgi:hypothetical protein